MPYNNGPSLDMINESVPETAVMKDPNAINLANKFVGSVGSYDVNDLSFQDITDKAGEYSNKIWEMLGLNDKVEESKPVKVEKPSPQINEEKSLSEEVSNSGFENNLSSKTNTKSLQNYMANPDDDLKSLVGDKKYEGPIDGFKNDELNELIRYLEVNIAKTIGSKEVFGVIANTHVGDIKNAVKKVVGYKKYLMRNKVADMSLDDRFVELAKFIK